MPKQFVLLTSNYDRQIFPEKASPSLLFAALDWNVSIMSDFFYYSTCPLCHDRYSHVVRETLVENVVGIWLAETFPFYPMHIGVVTSQPMKPVILSLQ